jgi:hypothetical protein
MKFAVRFLYVIGIICFSATFVSGQEYDLITRLKTQLLLYRTQKNDQIVVVQTDKTLYRQGETIWMKGYVTDAVTHSLSLNSLELSVQLVDDDGISILEGMFLLKNGVAGFNFPIPGDLPSDVYFLIAYTPEMENNGIQTIFKKEIIIERPENLDIVPRLEYSKPFFFPDCKETASIHLMNFTGKPVSGKKFEYQIYDEERELLSGKGKTGANGTGEVVFFTPPVQNGHALLTALTIPSGRDRLNLVSKIPLASEKVNIRFFPEGGGRVPGITQVIVYEAVDQLGNPLKINADIIDEQGTTIVSTSTIIPGIGAFSLFNTDEKWKMRIMSDIGKNQETPLPSLSPGSMSIEVNKKDGNNLSLLLGRSPGSEPARFTIIAVCDGDLIWSGDFELEQQAAINVPLENFHSEIAAIAIFGPTGEIVANRLISTGRKQSLNIAFTTDKEVYKKGEEGRVKVKITDRDGRPVKAELAVSLADKYAFPASFLPVGMLDYGFGKPLPFDLKLEKSDDKMIDYSLAVNNLKGFNWNRVIAKDPSKTSNNKIGAIRISGCVVDEKKIPVSNALISLSSSSLQQFNTTSNPKGEFEISMPVSVDKKNLSVSATDGSGKGNYQVILNKSFKDELANNLKNSSFINWRVLDQINKSNYFKENPDYYKTKTLAKVRSGEKNASEPYWKKYINGSSNLLEILMTVRPYEMSGGKIIFRGINSFVAQDGALIVIDGQRMGTEASQLSLINPQDVEDIRILLDPVEMGKYSGLNSVGVIEIKTKHGGTGYGISGELTNESKDYGPKVFIPEAIGESRYDLKTTLQWIPFLFTDERGEVTIPFKTGGIKSTFIFEIAGYTNQRQWIGSQTEIRVE